MAPPLQIISGDVVDRARANGIPLVVSNPSASICTNVKTNINANTLLAFCSANLCLYLYSSDDHFISTLG